MLEAAHLWLVCRDGIVQFSCSSVQLHSHCQRFVTGPARFGSVLVRSVNTVYDSLPIAEFGKAMWKGMGWRPGEAIGLTNKGSVNKHT